MQQYITVLEPLYVFGCQGHLHYVNRAGKLHNPCSWSVSLEEYCVSADGDGYFRPADGAYFINGQRLTRAEWETHPEKINYKLSCGVIQVSDLYAGWSFEFSN